jgi:RNA polymerase sigma factor (sigma-70 family)
MDMMTDGQALWDDLIDIADKLAEATPRQRVVLCRTAQGYPQRHIGGELGVSQQAVSRLLRRARESLHRGGC